MKKYERIKYEDCCQIYALSKRGSSQESLAEVLGVVKARWSGDAAQSRSARLSVQASGSEVSARQAIRSKACKLTALMRLDCHDLHRRPRPAASRRDRHGLPPQRQ